MDGWLILTTICESAQARPSEYVTLVIFYAALTLLEITVHHDGREDDICDCDSGRRGSAMRPGTSADR